jgi:hypothetical protein
MLFMESQPEILLDRVIKSASSVARSVGKDVTDLYAFNYSFQPTPERFAVSGR